MLVPECSDRGRDCVPVSHRASWSLGNWMPFPSSALIWVRRAAHLAGDSIPRYFIVSAAAR